MAACLAVGSLGRIPTVTSDRDQWDIVTFAE